MQKGLLPLFPLQVVVFPRTPLPLHIFEDRYKEMVGEAIRDKTEFGIVLARENGILNIGCTVSVLKVLKQYPDGRFDILGVGRRRFEVLMLDEEKDYLRGAVEFFDDEAAQEATPADVREQALGLYRQVRELGDNEEAAEPAAEDPQLSFQLAQIIPDLDFRQILLRMRSESERMKRVLNFLTEYLPKARLIAKVRSVAPHNGHSRLPIGLPNAS